MNYNCGPHRLKLHYDDARRPRQVAVAGGGNMKPWRRWALKEVKQMMPGEWSLLVDTIDHFKEIARQNRFAENSSFDHETHRCLICHPQSFPVDPFVIYLKVVTEAIKVRRPRLDEGLIEEINSDIEFLGEPGRISRESLLADDPQALRFWSGWVREALATGLGLLSIHSKTSLEFTLEEAEERGLSHMIEARVKEIMAFQKQNG
jgi:hypothetical protein